MKTYKPSVLPDDRRFLLVLLSFELAMILVGWFFSLWPLLVLGFLGMVCFPGLTLFFHLIYAFGFAVRLDSQSIQVRDWISSKYIPTFGNQSIRCDRIARVYFLEDEIDAVVHGKNVESFYSPSKINIQRMRQALDSKARHHAWRSRAALVLCDQDSGQKVYLMHFPALSNIDKRKLLRDIEQFASYAKISTSVKDMQNS